ncbi:telomere length regulation protein TEL2-like [Tropilaelaps mercedesae]|uniref:Telomere length regulation protein TEL2-like n=1 Tax=Tropilaelaps mercedesae TaxID=418985 RepID=A0A1V9XLH9_9ACAR|nr:telomere length regulation protein TEL2-like [Tropilaelaps mercedesae]
MECAERLRLIVDGQSVFRIPKKHSHVSGTRELEQCVFLLKKVLRVVDVEIFQEDVLCFLSHLDPSVVLRELSSALCTVEEGFKKFALARMLAKVLKTDFLSRLLAEQLSPAQARAVSALVVNLPSKVSNTLKLDLPESFNLSRYPPLLTQACCARLIAVTANLREGKDSSLISLCALVGKLGVHYPETFDELVPFFLSQPEDFIFRRVVQRLVVGLPTNLQENAIVLICYRTPCFRQMDWLLEESITRDANIKHILTNKLILGRYFSNARVLKNVIGYLCSSPRRRKLASETAVELFQTWSDKVLMKYQTVEQQRYLTCALLTFVGFTKENFVIEESAREKCVQACLLGVKNHLAEPDELLRNYGMIVGREFLAVVRSDVKAPDFPVRAADYNDLMSFLKTPSEAVEKQLTTLETELKSIPETFVDSDDDSEPDEKDDIVYEIDPQCKVPRYLRDCLRLMVPGSDGENVEQAKICLENLPNLIKRYPEELYDTAVDLCRLVLFAEECPRIFPEITPLKRESLVLLLIHAPIQSSAYLIEQFYSVHINHTQRLEILSAITLASDRYAKEVAMLNESQRSKTADNKVKSSNILRNIDRLTVEPRIMAEWTSDDFEMEDNHDYSSSIVNRHWRDIVDEKISSKTRKIASKTEVSAQENRFGEVAGYFFYPLMRQFTGEVPLRVEESDSFLLVRLLETLGVVMSSARHTPRAYQMGRTLLQFASAFRYHDHELVRKACSFAIASVFTSVPKEILENEDQLGLEAAEIGRWLNAVTVNSPSFEVRIPQSSVGVQLGPSQLSTRRIQELG